MLTWILCVRAAREESGRALAATGALDEPT
jgi:hypothetical protein